MTAVPLDVILRDAIEGLCALAPGSVDLVFSDLPSGATAAPTDRPPNLPALIAATKRALKPTGVAVFMASHLTFAAEVLAAAGDFYRYDLVWEKSLATGFLNARRQPMRAHEHLLICYRKPGTYNAQVTDGHALSNTVKAPKSGIGINYGVLRQKTPSVPTTTRRPRSVLRFPSVGTSSKSRVHHQQKHPALCEWVIRTYSNEGDFVVDPYAGSGVAVREAQRLGRRAEGYDTDPKFGMPEVACA